MCLLSYPPFGSFALDVRHSDSGSSSTATMSPARTSGCITMHQYTAWADTSADHAPQQKYAKPSCDAHLCYRSAFSREGGREIKSTSKILVKSFAITIHQVHQIAHNWAPGVKASHHTQLHPLALCSSCTQSEGSEHPPTHPPTIHSSVHVQAASDEDVCPHCFTAHPALKRVEAAHAQGTLQGVCGIMSIMPWLLRDSKYTCKNLVEVLWHTHTILFKIKANLARCQHCWQQAAAACA